MSSDEVQRIRAVYSTIYSPNPDDKSYIWHPCNPVSVYYRQARERMLVNIFCEHIHFPLSNMRVLDIGCGTGGFLRFLINMGIPPNHLYGLDLMFNRIKIATQRSSKHSSFCIGNGDALPYPTSKFDLVSQFTVFSSILDCRMRRHVAGEMVRVLKAQ